jgi:hypothetical protein
VLVLIGGHDGLVAFKNRKLVQFGSIEDGPGGFLGF